MSECDHQTGTTLYENPLARPEDVRGFIMEGPGAVSFPRGRMRLESTQDPGPDTDQAANQRANLVFWCPEVFPDHIEISWEFTPLHEPGLAILFFAAVGRDGKDLFDPSLAPRTGPYEQYHHGDIHALHVSYFRRRYAHERAFHLCNLRKSYGFHMVAQGADPIPPVRDAVGPYQMTVTQCGRAVTVRIRGVSDWQPELEVLRWADDGAAYGSVLGGGRIGFRQMAPLVAEYANLRVCAIDPSEETGTLTVWEHDTGRNIAT
jgi:hypothetical protein